MIIKDGTDIQTESHKEQLGLKGDVYVIGHFIESLESHRRLIPESKATTIEEAEKERLEFMRAEEKRLAELAAKQEDGEGEEPPAEVVGYDS